MIYVILFFIFISVLLVYYLINRKLLTKKIKIYKSKQDISIKKLNEFVDTCYNKYYDNNSIFGFVIVHPSGNINNIKSYDIVHKKGKKTVTKKCISKFSKYMYDYFECSVTTKFLEKFTDYVYLASFDSNSISKKDVSILVKELTKLGFIKVELKN